MKFAFRPCALAALLLVLANGSHAQQRRAEKPSLINSVTKVVSDPVTVLGNVVTPTQEKKKKVPPRKYGVKVTQKDMEKTSWSPWFSQPAVSIKNLVVGVGQVPGKLVKGSLAVVTGGNTQKRR